MNATYTPRRVQRLLYGLAVLVFLASVVELLAAKHYDEPTQLIPFAMAGAGIATVVAVWLSPTVKMLRWAQIFLVLCAGLSLLGMYFHLEGNMEFVREIRPDASLGTVLKEAFTGRDPILAPGVLALGAFLGYIGSRIDVAAVASKSALDGAAVASGETYSVLEPARNPARG